MSRFLGLLLFLFAAGNAVALDPRKSVDEYAFETWDTESGLPHNQVQSIAQTPDGYLWFGTWEGAVRFNAREFRLFDRRAVPALHDNGVRALLVDRQGALWMGTSRGGVTRLHEGEWQTFNRATGLLSDEVLCLRETRDGRIWIGMEEGGVSILEGDRVRNLTTSDGLRHNTVLAVADTADGDVWIATSAGLNRYRDGHLSVPDLGPDTPTTPVLDVFVDAKDRVYVGTDHGLFVLRDGQLQRAAPGTALDREAIGLTYEDSLGTLWIGTLSGGLIRFRDGQVDVFGVEQGLPHKRVIAVTEDREGSLWVGTSAGLVRLKDAPFSTYGAYRGLSEHYVRSVQQSRDGTLWIGTGNGLNRLVGRDFSHYWPGGDPAGNYVMSMFEDRDGALWVGTYDSGLSRFDGRQFEAIDSRSGLAGDQVRAILRTRDGALWVGTTNGLNRLEEGRIQRFGRAEGMPREYVFSLFEDQGGQLWVGTTAGAARFREGRFDEMPLPPGEEVKDFFAFHQTSDGVMWAATGDGLLRHRDGESRIADSRHGPIPDALFNLVEDERGYFWMGTNRGVFRVARADLDAVLDGLRTQFPARAFGKNDGLATNQCNGGSQPSAWRADDGRLWFATAKGLSFVDPKQVDEHAALTPPVVIEELRIDGLERNPRHPMELAPGRHKVEVEFAGLSFREPERVRFRYRMAPYDTDWIETGSGLAVYTNLPPGTYRFSVQAAMWDAPFDASEQTFSLKIAPRLWQMRSVQALLLLMSLMLVVLLMQWRTRSLRARERWLSQLVLERTRDLEHRQQELLLANDEKSRLLDTIRAQAEEAERLARTDVLTGLSNRRSFDSRMAQAYRNCVDMGRPIAVAQIDVDHFKQINDRYSHASGDEVLRAVGILLARQFPTDEGLVARYGGEEFVVAFPDTCLAEAVARCERMREAVAELRFPAIAPDLLVTVSVGVAERGLDTAGFEKLLAAADVKLYEAKRGGRNRVCA